jgi:hypothetical protein
MESYLVSAINDLRQAMMRSAVYNLKKVLLPSRTLKDSTPGANQLIREWPEDDRL